jgi:hypothetical protein
VKWIAGAPPGLYAVKKVTYETTEDWDDGWSQQYERERLYWEKVPRFNDSISIIDEKRSRPSGPKPRYTQQRREPPFVMMPPHGPPPQFHPQGPPMGPPHHDFHHQGPPMGGPPMGMPMHGQMPMQPPPPPPNANPPFFTL